MQRGSASSPPDQQLGLQDRLRMFPYLPIEKYYEGLLVLVLHSYFSFFFLSFFFFPFLTKITRYVPIELATISHTRFLAGHGRTAASESCCALQTANPPCRRVSPSTLLGSVFHISFHCYVLCLFSSNFVFTMTFGAFYALYWLQACALMPSLTFCVPGITTLGSQEV